MAGKPQSAAHGYSGKPLYQKLGLKPGTTYLTLSAPGHYRDLVSDAEGITFRTHARC